MTIHRKSSTRRAFFLQGGAALGAGLATTAGATALAARTTSGSADPLKAMQRELAAAQEREAIRRLHAAFTSLIEAQRYEAAAELFGEQASVDLSGVAANGRSAIEHLFADEYRHQKAPRIHSAYRPNALQPEDAIALSDDQRFATAVYHVDVSVCAPLQDDCTAAQMARLQGNVAERRWESGRIVAKYEKIGGAWKMTTLRYVAS